MAPLYRPLQPRVLWLKDDLRQVVGSSPYSSEGDTLTCLLVYSFTPSWKFFQKSQLNCSLIKVSL